MVGCYFPYRQLGAPNGIALQSVHRHLDAVGIAVCVGRRYRYLVIGVGNQRHAAGKRQLPGGGVYGEAGGVGSAQRVSQRVSVAVRRAHRLAEDCAARRGVVRLNRQFGAGKLRRC